MPGWSTVGSLHSLPLLQVQLLDVHQCRLFYSRSSWTFLTFIRFLHLVCCTISSLCLMVLSSSATLPSANVPLFHALFAACVAYIANVLWYSIVLLCKTSFRAASLVGWWSNMGLDVVNSSFVSCTFAVLCFERGRSLQYLQGIASP